jgi:glycosyltransferase involved in cell wall biosynthesis
MYKNTYGVYENKRKYYLGLSNTVGIDADLPQDPGLPSMASESIGIIGSDNPANCEGLDLFLVHSWPVIRAHRPEARLCIAGKLGIALQAQLSDGFPEGVTTLGWIPDLSHFYRDLRLVVNPVVRGTGLKIKSVEALAHARPLVAYPVGIEGIDCSVHPLPFCVVTDPQLMADACIQLLSDPGRCDAMAESAMQYALDHLSSAAVYAPLAKLLER